MRRAIPILLLLGTLTACTSAVGGHASISSPAVSTPAAPSTTTPAVHPATSLAPVHSPSVPHPASTVLPLNLPTGTATRVITVVAPSASSTIATLRAWQKSGTGWVQVGGGVTAHLGSAGLSTHPSESSTATPIGSFTLTQAFGSQPDPGTALPYRQTTPADWWISQSGPLYNTLQHCASSCPFTQGEPNEHLYYAVPYYRYAVVIDYNTANAPGGIRQGAGSAFFLHVTVGEPTQGCISIPESRLVELLRWLSPSAHPRILIGVA